ncbi:MbtH family protein [Streptomyces sp. NPDC020996]|uniref:MbtH family protein n=1 Tax=Streptomyces sp. NPDC020996 TaxID=3154791 RepID=UPI003405BC77
MSENRPPSDGPLHQVVLNHEEQYSVWPAHREPPPGWRPEGFTGTRQECLDRIAEVWTDLRPLSVRRTTAASVSASVPASVPASASASVPVPASASASASRTGR